MRPIILTFFNNRAPVGPVVRSGSAKKAATRRRRNGPPPEEVFGPATSGAACPPLGGKRRRCAGGLAARCHNVSSAPAPGVANGVRYVVALPFPHGANGVDGGTQHFPPDGGATDSVPCVMEGNYLLRNHFDHDTARAIRDALPRDPQLAHFALRRAAVDHRLPVADLEHAIAALPEPAKLTRDERNARDLADLADRRDEAARRGYLPTAAKLGTAIEIVERHQEAQRHRRTADLILDGQKRRAASDRRRPGAESAAIVAAHAAGEALATIRAGRQAPARVHLRDGERLRVR